MFFSCLIVTKFLANVYTGRFKKKKLDRLKNFVCTFAIEIHTHNTTNTHTPIQALCTVKGSTRAHDNVFFLLQDFNGRCACAVKVEGRHWGLVN